MINLKDYAVIILAAGLSTRFGEKDKLLEPFNGEPMINHVARLAAGLGVSQVFAVTSGQAVPKRLKAFEVTIINNENPELGMGRSLSLAASAVNETAAKGAILMLGDMPLLTAADIVTLCSGIGDAPAAIATDGVRRMPPALFKRPLFGELLGLSRDEGAKAILSGRTDIEEIMLPANHLVDIDDSITLNELEGEVVS